MGHTLGTTGKTSTSSVHPHIRGAYNSFKGTEWPKGGSSPHTWGIRTKKKRKKFLKNGSSPHTWGIHWDDSCLGCLIRFIPTYVGHTDNTDATNKLATVHPHIRGAYACQPGSCGNSGRFIPTYVGHTGGQADCDLRKAVHPHIRGAYPPSAIFTSWLSGSSPHTWGIRWLDFHQSKKSRFIPTYVGHTPRLRAR